MTLSRLVGVDFFQMSYENIGNNQMHGEAVL